MKANLTEKVRRQVVKNILNGDFTPGEKIPTEREMSELTKTSRITVRRAYDQLEKANIINRIQGAGTRVATTFRGNQEDIEHIALMTTLRDPFALDFIEAAEKAVTANDSLFILALTDGCESETDVAIRLASEGVKNIIIWGSSAAMNMEVFKRLRILGINIVFFDRIIPGPFADFVGLDNRHALKLIIDDAEKKQCHEFMFVDYADIDFDSNRERRDAFIKLCKQKNLPFTEITIPFQIHDPQVVKAIYQNNLAGKIGNRTAIVCVNDSAAMQIENFAKDAKIYSIDGREEAIKKGIITYSQPIAEMAKASVAALISQQKKGDSWKASSIRFKGKLEACN